MKLVIKTGKFQEMVAKATKGASENKLLAITSMMAISLKEGVLTLTTTDTANTLKVIAADVEGDDFYVVVPVGVFSRLIAKTTSDIIQLTLKDNSLEVKGNGIYNIALPVDEEGPIVFPEYVFKKAGEARVVSLATVRNVLSINTAAIAKTLDTPCLCGYYTGERVVTTDENVICFNEVSLLGENALISPEMMELLGLNTQEKILMYRDDNHFLFETPDIIVYGTEHEGIDVYPYQEVLKYLTEAFPSVCTIPKLFLQNVIDRLSLFIEPYDKNGAYFTFTEKGIRVTSKRSSSAEFIQYATCKTFAPFICCVDIPMFKQQLDANPAETINLWFGNDSAIKLTCDKVTQVIALLEDENLEDNSAGKK